MERGQQIILFPPIQASPIVPAESDLYFRLLERLRPYLESVLENPSKVESIAERLLGDASTMILYILASQDALIRATERDLIEAYGFIGERFKNAGIDVKDVIEVILEHDLWRLRQIRSNFGKFAIMYLDFIEKYPEDAYKYVITLLSIVLLLLASYITESSIKLQLIGEELNKISEELESYTLTFMLTLEKPEKEETRIIVSLQTLEELRKVLGVE